MGYWQGLVQDPKGSFLGTALANDFVGYYESKLFQTTSKPEMYYRYMDDTFVVFSNEDECNLFQDGLNSLSTYAALTFALTSTEIDCVKFEFSQMLMNRKFSIATEISNGITKLLLW